MKRLSQLTPRARWLGRVNGMAPDALMGFCQERLQKRRALPAGLQLSRLRPDHLKQLNLVGARLDGVDLSGGDLSEMALWDVSLKGANLAGAKLDKANLWGANLTRANLTDARLQDATLLQTRLRRANLQGANLRGAQLNQTDFSRANLAEANLSAPLGFMEEQWEDYSPEHAIQGVNFTRANLHNASLIGRRITDTAFQGADLRGAAFGASQPVYDRPPPVFHPHWWVELRVPAAPDALVDATTSFKNMGVVGWVPGTRHTPFEAGGLFDNVKHFNRIDDKTIAYQGLPPSAQFLNGRYLPGGGRETP